MTFIIADVYLEYTEAGPLAKDDDLGSIWYDLLASSSLRDSGGTGDCGNRSDINGRSRGGIISGHSRLQTPTPLDNAGCASCVAPFKAVNTTRHDEGNENAAVADHSPKTELAIERGNVAHANPAALTPPDATSGAAADNRPISIGWQTPAPAAVNISADTLVAAHLMLSEEELLSVQRQVVQARVAASERTLTDKRALVERKEDEIDGLMAQVERLKTELQRLKAANSREEIALRNSRETMNLLLELMTTPEIPQSLETNIIQDHNEAVSRYSTW